MSDLRKAAEMALEDICGAKLCEVNSMSSRVEMLRLMDKAAETLRQALAQPEQKREWVGLTDDEAWGCWNWEDFNETWKKMEAKLKEKNT